MAPTVLSPGGPGRSSRVTPAATTTTASFPSSANRQRTRGPSELFVVRGGSFFNDCGPRGLVVTTRLYSLPESSGYDVGFRVCARASA